MLYLFDRETFTQVTGLKKLLPYNCKCSIARIDSDDESDPTPYERDVRDVHLTRETQDYLEEKHDVEVEKPKRRLRNILWCCFGTKKYDESDKYQVPWTGSEDEATKGKNAGNVNVMMVFLEDLRLRFFWRPTKEYDARDKYDVGDSTDDDEIKYAASSYESAEVGTAPW